MFGTKYQRRAVAYIAAVLVAPLSVLSGCSHSAQPPASGSAAAPRAAGAAGAPHSAAEIQSNMDKIKSDSSLSSAQKQIMLNEMQHAMPGTAGAK